MILPCNNCPFRLDVIPYLRRDRAEEITECLKDGGDFSCHKTTRLGEDGENHTTKDSKFCAGAIGVMQNTEEDGALQNQMVRIGLRLGLIDERVLDQNFEGVVYPDFQGWIDSQED